MLRKNLEAFNSRYPNVDLLNIKDEEPDFVIENSKSGEPTAILDGAYIHSRHNPKREATKLSRQFSESDMIVIGGFGLGYITQELCSVYHNRKIVVVESSKKLFYQALKTRDLTDILLNPKVYFIIGDSYESINNFLIPQYIKKVEYLPLLSRTRLDEVYFDSLERVITTYLERMEINKKTLIKFGKLWVKNQTKNLPVMGYKGDLSVIFNKFNNIPGIIISAGPSMELIIPVLKQLKERFLLLSVDTALKSLIDEGIEPDFVMSIDSQYWNSRHLTGVKTEKCILVADSSIPPAAIRNFGDRVYFTKSPFPIGKYFENSREPFPQIASGGSVSTNLWDFAHKLGLSEVFFIGQDLGYPGNITHYKNSYFEKNMLITSNKVNSIEKQSFKYIYSGYPCLVKSNRNNLILSDKRMNIYIKWFTEKLRHSLYKESYNLSPNGCRLEGMDYRDITELTNYNKCRREIQTVMNNLKKCDNNFYLKEILEAALSFKEDLKNIKNITYKALTLSLDIEKKFQNNLQVSDDLQNLNLIDNKIVETNQKDTLSFIIEPFISEVTETRHNNPLDALRTSQKLYNELYTTSILHLKYLNQSIKKIEIILK